MVKKVKVFFWCSLEGHDKMLLDGLLRQLSVYKWNALVDVERSDEFDAGVIAAQVLDATLSSAQIVLPLVSPYFPWNQNAERKLLSRWKAGEIKAFTIFLSSISLRDTSFANLTVLPTDNGPVDNWIDKNRALFSIAEYLDKEIKQTVIENLMQEAQKQKEEHKYEEALNNYQQVLTLDDRLYLAHKGREDIDRILRENFELKKHYARLIEKYVSEKQYTMILSICQEMEDKLPEEAFFIYRCRGDALRGRAEYEEALVSYKKAISIDPQSPQVYVGIGETYWKLDRYEDAVKCFRQAKTLSPKAHAISRRLGEMLMFLRRFEEALKEMNEIVLMGINDGQVYADIGLAYLECKKYKEAIHAFDQAMKLGCKNASVCMRKGQALSASKRWQEARIAYEEAISYASDHAVLHKELADVLYEMQLYKLAEDYYTRAINLSTKLVNAFDGRARVREILAEEDRRIAKRLRIENQRNY